jgi:hypothetical protein
VESKWTRRESSRRAGAVGGESTAGAVAGEAAVARCRARRIRSGGVSGGAIVPTWVGFSEGMPTGEPQRGQTDRRAAISSRALRCFPQVQTNLMVMPGLNPKSEIRNPKSAFRISDFEFSIFGH